MNKIPAMKDPGLCQLIRELKDKKGFSFADIAKLVQERGYRSRSGSILKESTMQFIYYKGPTTSTYQDRIAQRDNVLVSIRTIIKLNVLTSEQKLKEIEHLLTSSKLAA